MNENPFRRSFVETRFGFVHYWTAGGGQDLLLLHQSAQSADEFLETAKRLADDWRVVALDLPGHGASDTPDHELGVDEYCESVLAVLDQLGVQESDVVAHHGGCMLAVNIAVSHPERVRKLVLSGGGYPDPDVADLLLNKPMTRDIPLDANGDFLLKTWAVYQKMSAPQTSLDTTFLPFVTGLKARLRPYDMHYEVLRWDYRAALDKLEHPALLIKAEHDHFAGDVEGLAKALPNAEMLVLPDCGPWLFYEQPDACADAISAFLDPGAAPGNP